MGLGKGIEKLRQKHRLSAAELSKGIISESNYSRFSRGKTMVSADVFVDLLKNMEADFYEISDLNYNPRVVDKYKAKYLELLNEKDYVGLRRLGKTVAHLSKVRFDTYHNVAMSIEVQLAKHEDRPINPEMHAMVKKHLSSIEQWSHKEAFIFEIFIESFQVDFILLMVENITRNYQNYMVAERNSHVIAMLFTTVIYFLKIEKQHLAEAVFELMRPYMMVVGLTTHKFSFTLAELLINMVDDPTPRNMAKIEKLHRLCLTLGNKSHSYKVRSNYESLMVVYDLPNIWDNE